MESAFENWKAGAKVAIGLLIVLLIGSIYFYKERMLFADASFIAFRIINYGTLQTQVDRHGAFITQLFPYIASKLHFPIKSVLLLYSISFNLFYLFVGGCLYRMKQYPLVILFAFYLTLYVSDTYFWTNNEVHQGVAWMFLDFGLLSYFYERFGNDRKKFVAISLPIFILLSFIAIYTHPLVMISFGFLWVFFAIKQHGFFSNKISILYAAIIVLICVFKFLASQNNWYDSRFLRNITPITLPAILKTFKSSLAHDFWHGGIKNYWLLWLIFIVGSLRLFIDRKYLLFTYAVVSCILYFMLICLVFYPSKAFYIESEWMSIAILGSVGFVYFFLPKLKANHLSYLLVFIFAVRIGYIVFSSKKFTARVFFLEEALIKMQQQHINKLAIIDEQDRLDEKLLLSWGLPYETILLSALNGDKPVKTMSYFKPGQIEQFEVRYKTNCIISGFGQFCNNELNSHYFHFDTASQYTIFSLEEWSRN